MNEVQAVGKSAHDLFREARAGIENMPSMREGAAAIEAAVAALEKFGFKTDRDVTSFEQTALILDEIGAFVDEVVTPVSKTLPETMSAEQAADIGKQLQLPFEVVRVFKNAVEGLKAIISDDFAIRIDDKIFAFRLVGPTTELTQEEYIRAKLGNDAQALIDELKKISVDISGKTPGLNTGTLRTESNIKTRLEQESRYGGELVDPIQGVNLAIEAVSMAKESGINLRTLEGETYEIKGSRIKNEAKQKGLADGTATVLEMLTSGIIRVGGGSGSGALGVFFNGRLSAFDYSDDAHPCFWAFGPGPALESET